LIIQLADLVIVLYKEKKGGGVHCSLMNLNLWVTEIMAF
jgi:hypothetical protein